MGSTLTSLDTMTKPRSSRGGSRIIQPLEKRLEAYDGFRDPAARGKSTHELVLVITKKFAVSRSTVYAWARGSSPFGTRCGKIIYTKELFYVIGALLGDGCIYHWRNSFQVWLHGERKFCTKYAERALACTTKRNIRAYPLRGRNVWFVQFQNAELYFLMKQIREHLDVLSSLLRTENSSVKGLQLIEGFFDAEGCVKVIKEPVRRTPKINLDFSNTNFALLEIVKTELKRTLNIEGRFSCDHDKRPNRHVMYHLRMYQKDAIGKFLSRVNTIKLKPAKVQYVRNWLEKNRGRKEERDVLISWPWRTWPRRHHS